MYQRIQTVIYARMRSNLIGPLRSLTSEQDAVLITELLTTTIDGIWLRCGLSLAGVTQQDARNQLDAVLDARLPDSEQRRAARARMAEVARLLTKARRV
jgi:TetR/AcrR family transcriptional repressor of bet genes